MSKQIRLALVVAKPGHLWNGLHSLLRTVPQIEIIAEAKDASVLLNMDADLQPDLLLLDANLFDEDTWPGITRIKDEWSMTLTFEVRCYSFQFFGFITAFGSCNIYS